ncbi:MAG: hypothetical protein AAFN77_19030 [Planctomycetota bacterium]
MTEYFDDSAQTQPRQEKLEPRFSLRMFLFWVTVVCVVTGFIVSSLPDTPVKPKVVFRKSLLNGSIVVEEAWPINGTSISTFYFSMSGPQGGTSDSISTSDHFIVDSTKTAKDYVLVTFRPSSADPGKMTQGVIFDPLNNRIVVEHRNPTSFAACLTLMQAGQNQSDVIQ